MLYSIKNREGLEKLEDLVSLQKQVDELRLQDKLDEQNFQEDLRKLYEPFTYTIKATFRDKTQTMTEILLRTTKH